MKRGVVLIVMLTVLSLLLAMIFVASTHVRFGRRALDHHLEKDLARATLNDSFQRAALRLSRKETLPVRAIFSKTTPVPLVQSTSGKKLWAMIRLRGDQTGPPQFLRAEAQLIWHGEACSVRLLNMEFVAWDESKELVGSED